MSSEPTMAETSSTLENEIRDLRAALRAIATLAVLGATFHVVASLLRAPSFLEIFSDLTHGTSKIPWLTLLVLRHAFWLAFFVAATSFTTLIWLWSSNGVALTVTTTITVALILFGVSQAITIALFQPMMDLMTQLGG